MFDRETEALKEEKEIRQKFKDREKIKMNKSMYEVIMENKNDRVNEE